MEKSKLKNVILVILLVTNILLLGLMVTQRAESRHYRRQTLLDAVDLLTQQGIAVRAEDIPDRDFPAPQVLKQDTQKELTTFSALLGQDAVHAQRGLVSLYTGSLGAAEIRDDGTFSVTLAEGAYPLEGQDIRQHALAVLERMGVSAQITQVQDQVLTAVETWKGVPIFTCAMELRYEDDQLRAISGTRLTGVPAADPQAGDPLSTATLLVRFRAGVIKSGDACTAVLSAAQGYILTSDANRSGALTPVLRLETDTNLYIVNALTGELRRE